MIFGRSAGAIVLFLFAAAKHQLHWPKQQVAPLVVPERGAGILQQYVLYFVPGSSGAWTLQRCSVHSTRHHRFTGRAAAARTPEPFPMGGNFAALAAIVLMTI